MPRRQPLEPFAEHFREHGWVLVPELVPADDIAAALPKLFELYPRPDEVASGARTSRTAPYLDAAAAQWPSAGGGTFGGGDRGFVPAQFVGLKEAPYVRWYFHNSGQLRFDDDEVAAAGPAGSVLAYSADTVHRGADMVEPGAGRFFFNLGYRAAGVDWAGALPWPRRGIDPLIPAWIAQLDARQLTAIGFPKPGHPYWDEETLAATAARYPDLDLTEFQC